MPQETFTNPAIIIINCSTINPPHLLPWYIKYVFNTGGYSLQYHNPV